MKFNQVSQFFMNFNIKCCLYFKFPYEVRWCILALHPKRKQKKLFSLRGGGLYDQWLISGLCVCVLANECPCVYIFVCRHMYMQIKPSSSPDCKTPFIILLFLWLQTVEQDFLQLSDTITERLTNCFVKGMQHDNSHVADRGLHQAEGPSREPLRAPRSGSHTSRGLQPLWQL